METIMCEMKRVLDALMAKEGCASKAQHWKRSHIRNKTIFLGNAHQCVSHGNLKCPDMCTWGLQRERRETGRIFEQLMAKHFKFTTKYESTDARSLANPKHRNYDNFSSTQHHSSKTSDKIFQASRGKGHVDLQTTKMHFIRVDFLTETMQVCVF